MSEEQIVTNQQLSSLVTNASDLMQRLGLAAQLGSSFNGKRQYYETLGYKHVLSYDDYENAYLRGDIASRIVDAPVDETWRNFPSVEEMNEQEEWSQWELDWQALSERLNVPQFVEIVDKVAGIGQYALLFLGASDSADLAQPLERVSGAEGMMYLSVFSQRQATISQFDIDPLSSRFGKPILYQIDIGAGQNSALLTGLPNRGNLRVHASRIIHVAENTQGDGLIGTPRLQKVMNRIDDLTKCVGGSAEMYWLGAYQGVIFEQDKDANMKTDDGKMNDELEKWMHGLQRYARLKGIKAYTLGAEIPHPQETFSVIIDCIAAATAIPKRILVGSERGELSSAQDETAWKDRMSKRETYAERVILRPLVERMIAIGALAEPPTKLKYVWPNRYELTPQEQAQVALTKTQAVAAYTTTPELVIPATEFVQWLGLEPSVVAQAQKESQEVPMNEHDQIVQAQFTDGQQDHQPVQKAA
jgi:hypothetical protein